MSCHQLIMILMLMLRWDKMLMLMLIMMILMLMLRWD